MSCNVMAMISNPDDFQSWSNERKLERYQRIIKWHEYIQKLFEAGKVTHVWGAHQLLSRAKSVKTVDMRIAVYSVGSWKEFDELLIEDPLRDISQYVTTPLCGLLEDKDTDLQRYERHKNHLLGNNALANRLYVDYRATYNQTPDYVGKYDYVQPPNPPTDMNTTEQPGDPLQVLIMGVNPNEYITMWDDSRKLVHHEKVTWWHDYMAMLISEGKISHAWGTHDFCSIDSLSGNSASAVAIYKTKDFEEFDGLYKLDPIRDATLFWSVLLQPIADQKRHDEKLLEQAKSRI